MQLHIRLRRGGRESGLTVLIQGRVQDVRQGSVTGFVNCIPPLRKYRSVHGLS